MRPIGGAEELKMRSGNEERRNHKRHKGADSICAFVPFVVPSFQVSEAYIKDMGSHTREVAGILQPGFPTSNSVRAVTGRHRRWSAQGSEDPFHSPGNYDREYSRRFGAGELSSRQMVLRKRPD